MDDDSSNLRGMPQGFHPLREKHSSFLDVYRIVITENSIRFTFLKSDVIRLTVMRSIGVKGLYYNKM